VARPKKLPKFLPGAEPEALLAAAESSPRDFTLMACYLYLGVRNSELAEMPVENVDLVSRRILVAEGKGVKDRYVPIPQSCTARSSIFQMLHPTRRRQAEAYPLHADALANNP